MDADVEVCVFDIDGGEEVVVTKERDGVLESLHLDFWSVKMLVESSKVEDESPGVGLVWFGNGEHRAIKAWMLMSVMKRNVLYDLFVEEGLNFLQKNVVCLVDVLEWWNRLQVWQSMEWQSETVSHLLSGLMER